MASGSEGHGSVQQQPGTGVQQQGNRLDPAASYPSLSLPVNSSTASCPPSPAVPMSPAGIPAPAAATPTLLSSSASPVTSSATPTATWSGGSHGSNSSGGDDLQPPQLRMPGTPPSPFTRRLSFNLPPAVVRCKTLLSAVGTGIETLFHEISFKIAGFPLPISAIWV